MSLNLADINLHDSGIASVTWKGRHIFISVGRSSLKEALKDFFVVCKNNDLDVTEYNTAFTISFDGESITKLP